MGVADDLEAVAEPSRGAVLDHPVVIELAVAFFESTDNPGGSVPGGGRRW